MTKEELNKLKALVNKMESMTNVFVNGEQDILDKVIKTLEQESRLVAHWIDNSDGGRVWNPFWDRYICSNCGRHSDLENYCCNCGAEMEDEE